jgi:hypothetical protein
MKLAVEDGGAPWGVHPPATGVAPEEHTRHFIYFVLGHFEVDDPTGLRELILLEVQEAEKRIRERHVANLAEGRRRRKGGGLQGWEGGGRLREEEVVCWGRRRSQGRGWRKRGRPRSKR